VDVGDKVAVCVGIAVLAGWISGVAVQPANTEKAKVAINTQGHSILK